MANSLPKPIESSSRSLPLGIEQTIPVACSLKKSEIVSSWTDPSINFSVNIPFDPSNGSQQISMTSDQIHQQIAREQLRGLLSE